MVNRRLIAACWVVRLALAASFLSAVADRLGLWGPPGAADVAWSSVPRYQEYVAQLNWFLPAGLVPVVGWAATACEVMLAIGLLIGWRLHWVAFVAGILLTVFAVMMAVALGPHGYHLLHSAAEFEIRGHQEGFAWSSFVFCFWNRRSPRYWCRCPVTQ
jgi:uncharacterized membrane protein YphA (DoxX/SURF4 family)